MAKMPKAYNEVEKMSNDELISAKGLGISPERLTLINAEIAMRIANGKLELPKTECFCCGKKLDLDIHCGDDKPHVISPVYEGLRFRSTGNFGSTIYDPMPISSREFLEIVVCDACIMKKKEKVRHVHSVRTSTTAEAKPFDPESLCV